MGKRLLTGAIGLLGVSVFLTGCNCCKQNNKQAFMNDRADSSLGVTKSMTPPGWNNKAQNSMANNPASSGNSSGSAAGTPSERGLDSAGGGSNGLGSGMSSGMGGMPATPSAGMQPTSSIPSVPGTSMANPPGGGTSLNDSNASMAPLPPSGSGSPTTTAGSIKTTSNHNDATRMTTADYKAPTHNVDGGVQHAAMGMDDASREPVPPTPMTALTSPSSDTTSKATPYPPTPSDAPGSMATDPALSTPAPTVRAPIAPSIPGSGAKTTPASMGSFPPGVN